MKRDKEGQKQMIYMPKGIHAVAVFLLPLLAMAETREIRAAIEPNASLVIKNSAGSVSVVGTDAADLTVVAELGPGVERLAFNESASRPVIEVVVPKNARRIDATLRVSLPRSVALEVRTVSADIGVSGVHGDKILNSVSGRIETVDGKGEIEAETVSGNVLIHGTHDEVQVETTSGSISLAGEAATLEVKSVSGGIESQMNVREMHVNTTSGSVTIPGTVWKLEGKSVSGRFAIGQAAGEVRIETVSGAIGVVGRNLHLMEAESFSGKLEYSGMTALDVRMNLRTRSGSVRVSLPETLSARLKLSSLSGNIRCDFPGVQIIRPQFGPGSSVDATIGDGKGSVEVETLSGGIQISNDGVAASEAVSVEPSTN